MELIIYQKVQLKKLWKTANYEEARVKLTNTQLNILKPAAKKQDWSNIKNSKENFVDEELRHELLLTARQITKIRNTITKYM